MCLWFVFFELLRKLGVDLWCPWFLEITQEQELVLSFKERTKSQRTRHLYNNQDLQLKICRKFLLEKIYFWYSCDVWAPKTSLNEAVLATKPNQYWQNFYITIPRDYIFWFLFSRCKNFSLCFCFNYPLSVSALEKSCWENPDVHEEN